MSGTEGTVKRDLEGKVALVTGGGRGIGRSITLSLAERGANVVICYLRRREPAEETCRLAEDHSVKAMAVRANVGEEEDLERLFDEIEETFGRLDVFVSNAATGVIRPVEKLDSRAWQWTMNANARAFFICARRAATMMEDGGSMIALSSHGSERVLPGYALVGASKAAIETLARYLAVELASRNIRVNVVSPGVVETGALKHFPDTEGIIEEAIAKTPAGRLATPQDVAAAVEFLTSERAAMITGHTLVIDGAASLVA
jgi:enoyl-[acyl-carrier protein] reductase III